MSLNDVLLTTIAGNLTGSPITLAVNAATGSDTPTPTRPNRIVGGDYSSEPFATIQAALNSLPRNLLHAVVVNVAAGSYQGFNMRGFNAGAGSLTVNGTQAQVTPTTGPASGTASSGSVNTLTLTGAGWTVDDFVGKFCRIISGTGAGQHFIIAENTADTLRFVARMSPAPDGTSVFEITEPTALLTSNDSYFYSGAHISGCIGSFTVRDFHAEGPSYGFTQVWAQCIFMLQRVTSKNCYYGFIGQESLKASWNQIGSLASTAHGIGFLSMAFFGNTSYEKGWLAVNAGVGADGLWINECHSGGCQGIWVKNCGNNGIGVWDSEADLYYVRADNNVDGLWVSGSKVIAYNFAANNNSKRGAASDYGGRIDFSNAVVGTGNGEWGVNAARGVGGIITTTVLPTITGALGDCTVDDVNALTWATHFATKNDYASFLARQALIVRAA